MKAAVTCIQQFIVVYRSSWVSLDTTSWITDGGLQWAVCLHNLVLKDEAHRVT